MNRIIETFKRFRHTLRVRYGVTNTTLVLLIAAIVCSTLARYSGFVPLSIVTFVLLVLAIMTARGIKLKDIPAKLGGVFGKFGGKVKSNAFAGKTRRADTEHKYYHCPQCSKMLRVPKGKGKIAISCPKCKEKFIKKM